MVSKTKQEKVQQSENRKIVLDPALLNKLTDQIVMLECRLVGLAKSTGVIVEYEWPSSFSSQMHKIRLCKSNGFYGIHYVDYWKSGAENLIRMVEVSVARRLDFSKIAKNFTWKVLDAVKAMPALIYQSINQLDEALSSIDEAME